MNGYKNETNKGCRQEPHTYKRTPRDWKQENEKVYHTQMEIRENKDITE